MALTDTKIRALKPKDKVYLIADGDGLSIEVAKSGSKLWRFRYRFNGKPRVLALGRYPEVTLAEARNKRLEARRKVSAGIDPGTERKRAKQATRIGLANTFGKLAEEYIDRKLVKEERAASTIKKAKWFLEQLQPIADMAISEIKSPDVYAVLKRLEGAGKHETAKKCRSFASRVFRYGVATGRGELDPAEPLRGALVTPKVKHHAAVLDPAKFGELLRCIDAYEGAPVTRLALQIAPHAMTRPGELRAATWDEIDLDKRVWRIDASRMKARKSHAIPLSQQVLAYLAELKLFTGPEGYLFPAFHTTRKPMSENTMNTAFRRMGYTREEVTSHGLRTTASTLLNESGLWQPDAIERALAHGDSDAIRGTYNRGAYWDERVKMMQWWSDHLDNLKRRGGESHGKVE
jgi:integrase